MKNSLLTLFILLSTVYCNQLRAQEPLHYTLFKWENNKGSYNAGFDDSVRYKDTKARFIESVSEKLPTEHYAVLMQMLKAEKFRGKRLKLSGYLKTENVQGSAGLWFNVSNSKLQKRASFKKANFLVHDEMSERAITGSADWQQYSIVVDVPMKGERMHFGGYLYGSGKVWLSDLQFQVVSENTPLTQKSTKTANK